MNSLDKLIVAIFAVGLMASASYASSHAPVTRVAQLTAKLAHQLVELAEYGPNSYYGPASKRTAKQLNAAIAAQNAGNPLPPMLHENGTVIQPSHWGYSGSGHSGSSGAAQAGGLDGHGR